MAQTADVGPEVLDFLFETLQIDESWSVREPREFTWWAHRLAQRIWAEPVRRSEGDDVVRVHAATAFVRDLPSDTPVDLVVSMVNMFAGMSAVVPTGSGDRIFLHASAVFHHQNVAWLQSLFAVAAALQVTSAHEQVDRVAALLGGRPAVSEHPRSGARSDPDGILGMNSIVVTAGEASSPWTKEDFEGASERDVWVMAFADDDIMTAQIPFTGHRVAGAGGSLETSLLIASAKDPHPALGSGLLLRLLLPVTVETSEAAAVAAILNRLETTSDVSFHSLGAWCAGPPGPSEEETQPLSVNYVSFLPTILYQPLLLDNMAIGMIPRSLWAATLLSDLSRDDGSVDLARLGQTQRRALSAADEVGRKLGGE